MRRTLIVPVILASFALSACGESFTAAAAVVNGTKIPSDVIEEEVESALASQQGQGLVSQDPNARVVVSRRVLEGFIIRIVRRHAAAAIGVRVTEQDIDDEIQRLVENFGQPGIDQTIAQQGWTQREFREQVHDFALNNKLFEKLAPVSEERLRAEYNAERSEFRQVKFSDITIRVDQSRTDARARALAQAAKARIEGGQSFAAVARDVSEDPGTKEEGGARGDFILANSLDVSDAGVEGGPGLGSHALRAPLNRVYGPVRTASGYHLLLVSGKRVMPFAQAKEEIRVRMQQTLGQPAVRKLDADALEEADVVVNPRYGEWEKDHIEPKRFYEPPTADPNEPRTGLLVTPAPVAPPPGG